MGLNKMQGALNKLWGIFSLLLFVHFVVKCVSITMTSVFSFDGAMNAQVAQSLARHFRYATTYNQVVDFNPIIQTGPPVLFPVAFLFKLFGETFTAGLAVNAIYLTLLVLGVAFLLKRYLAVDNFYLLITFLAIYGTPRLFDFGFGLYGELPSLFFLVMGIIAISEYQIARSKGYLVLSGLMLGLGYLTKVVALLAVPSFLLILFCDAYVEGGKRAFEILRKLIYKLLFFFGGLALPVFLFELFKLRVLGLNNYMAWWHGLLIEALKQAGVVQGYADTTNIVEKLAKHLDVLLQENLGGFLLLSVIVLLVFVFKVVHDSISQTQDKKHLRIALSYGLVIIFLLSLTYFSWWLLVTPTQKAWYRRIINGVVLLEILIPASMYIILNVMGPFLRGRLGYDICLWLRRFLLVLIFVYFSIRLVNSNNLVITFADSSQKVAIEEVAQFLRNLPESSEVFGYGWWQAPQISFASGKSFKDIYRNSLMARPGAKSEKYLVVDCYDATREYENVLSHYNSKLVKASACYYVYKLESRLPFYSDFTENERRAVDYNHVDFRKNNLNVAVRNIYVGEQNNNGKWAQSSSGLLLRYKGEQSLRVSIWVPDLSNYNANNIHLKVYVNRKVQREFDITEGGIKELIMPISGVEGDVVEISIVCDHVLEKGGDYRELSIFLLEIGLH